MEYRKEWNGVIRKAEIIRNWKEMGREGGRKRRKKGDKEASKYVKVKQTDWKGGIM